MLQINKYVTLTRRLPRLLRGRNICRKAAKDNCCKTCPPTYECVQPSDEDELDFEAWKKKQIHPFFRKKCPKDYKPYMNIFFFLCIPAIIFLIFNVFVVGEEKRKRPIFIEWEYLRIRNKAYPWDPVRTFYHNPKYNALPTGYEVEVPEDEEYDPRLPV